MRKELQAIVRTLEEFLSTSIDKDSAYTLTTLHYSSSSFPRILRDRRPAGSRPLRTRVHFQAPYGLEAQQCWHSFPKTTQGRVNAPSKSWGTARRKEGASNCRNSCSQLEPRCFSKWRLSNVCDEMKVPIAAQPTGATGTNGSTMR
jgi:hypothetical protein